MKLFAAALLGVVLLTSLRAHADGALVATLEARKVLRAPDGSEKFVSTGTVRPDDIFEYRTVYRNHSATALRRVAATLPVPQGFHYVADSTGPLAVEASLDGKTFAPAPLTRTVKADDGSEQTVEIPAHEYRFLRWQLGDIPAGAAATVTARIRFADPPAQLAARK